MKSVRHFILLVFLLLAVAAFWLVRTTMPRSTKTSDQAPQTSKTCSAAMAEYVAKGDEAVPQLLSGLQACSKTDLGYAGVSGDPSRSGPWCSAALRRIGSPAAVDALTSALESLPDNHECIAYIDVAKNLGAMGPAAFKAIPLLKARLHAQNPLLRAASAAALAQIDPAVAKEHALPVVLEDARSNDNLCQHGASLALHWIGPATPEAATAIETLNKSGLADAYRLFETD